MMGGGLPARWDQAEQEWGHSRAGGHQRRKAGVRFQQIEQSLERRKQMLFAQLLLSSSLCKGHLNLQHAVYQGRLEELQKACT